MIGEPGDGVGAPDGRSDEVGPRIAAARRDRGMTLAQVARLVGVSSSLISQIERGRSRPSITTLFGLAQALEVPVDAFFGEHPSSAATPAGLGTAGRRHPGGRDGERVPEPGRHPAGGLGVEPSRESGLPGGRRYVVLRGERPAIDIEGGVRWERLTPDSLEHFEFLELVYAPHAESNAELYRHPGTEAVLVLSGAFEITIGFDTFHLNAGDSMFFPSSMPHRYSNPTAEESRAVTVILRD